MELPGPCSDVPLRVCEVVLLSGYCQLRFMYCLAYNFVLLYVLGKVKVSVYKGDITNEQVDVIVNAANRDLDHIGGVAKAILDKGGKSIQKESWGIIKQRGSKPLKDGEAVVTKSGNLPCKMVVHAVGPKWVDVGSTNSKRILRLACVNSFLQTQKLNMTSIALPAIGSGIYGMPKDVCAEVMFDAVDEFARKGDPKKRTITDIRFVNIDDPSVQAFGKEFISRYGDNQESSHGNKTPGGGSGRISTGAEGGTSAAPPSRSNRDKNQNRNMSNNSRATTNDARESQPHRTSFGSSAANANHPLSSSGHSSSPNASYSNAVKKNTGGDDSRPPIVQEPRGREGKAGFSLPPGDGEDSRDKKEEGNIK